MNCPYCHHIMELRTYEGEEDANTLKTTTVIDKSCV